VLGAYYLFLNNNYTVLLNYFYVTAGAVGFIVFLYNKIHQYLIIENGRISKNIFYGFNNKIDLDEIQEIKKVKGNYILKSETKKLKIKINFIEKESLEKLKMLLKELNLPLEKTFLTN